jgi:Ca-activated chloride channel family protein
MAKIHLERMMHRNQVAVRGESAASYALVKLIPTAEGPHRALGLNLALVLDVSGSMYEEDGTGVTRLKRVQKAAMAAIQKLRPTDTLSVIAFAYNAQLLLPPTPLTEKARIEEVVNGVDMYDVDPGGTAMDEGMHVAMDELQKNVGQGILSQMLVLTDGETTGETRCRELAQQMPQQQMSLTLMGVGTEWNASLVKDLAKLGDGKWYYIDVDKPDEAERVFLEEFEHLTAATFTNVQMHVRPVKEVRVKRCRLVVPEIKELPLTEQDERHLVTPLGMLERDKSTRYVLDLSLPQRPDGQYVIAQVEVTYEVGGVKDTTGAHPLQITYSAAGQGYINAEVAKHIDEVQIYELNNNLQQAIASNNAGEIKRLAETIEKKGEIMGPRGAKKTMLARQALQELFAGGRVSKKTQLALEDSARLAEEMPSA